MEQKNRIFYPYRYGNLCRYRQSFGIRPSGTSNLGQTNSDKTDFHIEHLKKLKNKIKQKIINTIFT